MSLRAELIRFLFEIELWSPAPFSPSLQGRGWGLGLLSKSSVRRFSGAFSRKGRPSDELQSSLGTKNHSFLRRLKPLKGFRLPTVINRVRLSAVIDEIMRDLRSMLTRREEYPHVVRPPTQMGTLEALEELSSARQVS